jgi:predicted homoserine dehydrogenase-like protein
MSSNNKNMTTAAAAESIQNIGVIGLGRMGTAIANNIIKPLRQLVQKKLLQNQM